MIENDLNEQEQTLLREAERLENRAKVLRTNVEQSLRNRLHDTPIADRLVYAAFQRCRCGHGMAYDKAGDHALGAWACSAVLLGETEGLHSPRKPFLSHYVKSEGAASAGGATTRVPLDPEVAEVLCKGVVR